MIKIGDNREKLVDIRKKCPGIICDLSCVKLFKRKPLVREKVAKMLNKAKRYLPKGITFIIGDAYRSRKIQKRVFTKRFKKMRKQFPKWSKDRALKETKKYIAPFRGKRVSGHIFGGAIDIRLYHNGRKIPMRSKKFTYQENAKPYQKKLAKHIKENRQIMFDALSRAGLIQAPHEFWHWSYGDLWWAKSKGKKSTIYGPIYKLP
jgi:D-alanyl-D-alanine dipeptidase